MVTPQTLYFSSKFIAQTRLYGEPKKLPSVFMKYILIIFIFLVGCAPLRFYPEGHIGNQVQYYNSVGEDIICDYCGEKTTLFKIVNRKKRMCHIDYIKYDRKQR